MNLRNFFILHTVIAVGYAMVFFVVTGPLLTIYGINPNPEGMYMARWFGVGLLAEGLITWLARNATESAGGRAIVLALTISYGVGVMLALWGTLFGPFNVLGWIAVGFNLLFGLGFGYFQFMKPVHATR